MISFKQISNVELISRIEKLVRTERKITHLILHYILEIEERKLYAEMGYDGMYTYLTRALGYSEASAYRRLQAARLLKQVPEISEKVEEGSLNLSQLTQVQKCLKEQNGKGEALTSKQALEVLEKIENKNTFETEKVLAVVFDKPIEGHEKIKPQKDNSVRLEITLTDKQFAELEQAKNFLSHVCPDGNWSDVITHLAKIYNTKKINTPLFKSSDSHRSTSTNRSTLSVTARTPQSNSNGDAAFQYKTRNGGTINSQASSVSTSIPALKTSNLPPLISKSQLCARPRKYISVKTKRSLLRKAQYCCEYRDMNSGKRCASKYQLEFDHIQPWALGGSNGASNLRVLCRKHNNLMAAKAGLEVSGHNTLTKIPHETHLF